MKTLEIQDSIKNRDKFSDAILSKSQGNYSLNCAKLLYGRADIICKENNKLIKPRTSYLLLNKTKDGISEKKFIKELFGQNIDVKTGLKLIDATKNFNIGFFKKLETEVSHCIFNYNNHKFLNSFLHLYRSIEQIAVAFPLIYISRRHDFVRAVNELGNYFEKKKNELLFIDKFSKDIAEKSEQLSEYKIKFQAKNISIKDFAILARELVNCCNNLKEDFINFEEGSFDISFTNTSSFIVEVRNRMFHFSNDGNNNIDIDKIGGSSELCRMIVSSGLHWLALAFNEIFQAQAERVILQ